MNTHYSGREMVTDGYLSAETVGMGEVLRRLYIPALALLSFSYALTLTWSLLADFQPGTVNFVVKGLICVLFVVSLSSSVNARRFPPMTFVPLYIFFTLYGLRMVDDVLFNGIVPPGSSPAYVLLYFFGLTFMPAIAVALAFEEKDLIPLGRWMFALLVLSNLSLVYYIVVDGGIAVESAFAGRFQVEGDVDTTTVLNPITVSLYGALLVVVAIGRLAVFDEMTGFNKIFHVALIPLGVFNLLTGGSRGPLVDLAVAVLLMAGAMVYTGVARNALRISPLAILVLGMSAFMVLALAASSSIEINVFSRLESMFDPSGGRAEEERDFLFAAAWQDFVDSPLMGKSYLLMGGITFAHNSFLDALAAVGFYGGLAYIFSFYVYTRGLWASLTGGVIRHAYPIALASVVYVALSMTSGSVSQSPETWVMNSLMMCVAHVAAVRRTRAQPARPGMAWQTPLSTQSS